MSGLQDVSTWPLFRLSCFFLGDMGDYSPYREDPGGVPPLGGTSDRGEATTVASL